MAKLTLPPFHCSSGIRAHGDDGGGRPRTRRSGMRTVRRTPFSISAYGVAGLDPMEKSLEKSSYGCLGDDVNGMSSKRRSSREVRAGVLAVTEVGGPQ